MKELFQIKLGSMTIDEYGRIFLELLKYVSFIKDETVNIHRYLSGMPSFIIEKIQYDDPKNLEETIRRAKCLYDQYKGKPTFERAWEDKKKFKREHSEKFCFVSVFKWHFSIEGWGCYKSVSKFEHSSLF
jgi:hypothetical protein